MFSFLNPYVLLGGLVALITVGGGGYLKGRADSSAKYEYAAIQAERDDLKKLLDVQKIIAEADAKRAAVNADLLRDLQEKAEEDAKSLEDATRECFSGDDTLRLRQHFRKAP